MHALGYDHVWETSGKQLALKNHCHYCDYLQENGLLDAFRDMVTACGENHGKPGLELAKDGDAWPFAEEHHIDVVTGRQIRKAIAGRPKDQPSFVLGSFCSPHKPFDPPQRFLDQVRYEEVDYDFMMICFRNINDHNVQPSETNPCGAALNALINDSHRHWFIPAGTYLIEETLRLPSGTRLTLDPAATLRLADGAARTENDYLLTNANPRGGDRDIAIEGGTFDGNQIGNPRPEGLFAVGYTGAMIHFENVRGLTLKNLTMTNAEAYYSRYTHVHDFHIEGINFDSQKVRHNNDGIHIGGNCSHGVIRRIRAVKAGVTGDDLVALNADDALTRNEVRGMTNGSIEDVLIEDLVAHSCHSFVRLLSVFSPIRNVTIRKVRGGCHVGALNADGARGCRVPVFDEANPPYPDGVGLLENIHASDLFVHKAGPNSMALVDLQERLRNITITEFKRDTDRDLSPETPTLRLRHQQIENGLLNAVPFTSKNTQPPNPSYEANCATIELTLNVPG